MRGFALLLLAVSACAHGRGDEALRKVPILVAQDVLVGDPASFPRAQPLREALVSALLEEGFCLDQRGDFEIFLQLRVDHARGESALRLTLTVDKATGVRLDEFEERLLALPASRRDAESLVRPLVRELEGSSAARDHAASSPRCRGCCAAPRALP
jgi:hypothetical protein